MQELERNLDLLNNFGFERIEEETTNPNKLIWYRKRFVTSRDAYFYLEVELEQSISDFPDKDNFSNYTLNEIYLINSDFDIEYYPYKQTERNAVDNGSIIQKYIAKIKNLEELFYFIHHGDDFFKFL